VILSALTERRRLASEKGMERKEGKDEPEKETVVRSRRDRRCRAACARVRSIEGDLVVGERPAEVQEVVPRRSVLGRVDASEDGDVGVKSGSSALVELGGGTLGEAAVNRGGVGHGGDGAGEVDVGVDEVEVETAGSGCDIEGQDQQE
jgi:hypothetical protein